MLRVARDSPKWLNGWSGRGLSSPGAGHFPPSMVGVLLVATARSFLPNSQQSLQYHQLADMVGVVISDQQGLAQDCLPLSPGNLGIKIGLGIGDQLLHGF